MRIRIKKRGFLLDKKIDSNARIDEIVIKESLLDRNDEVISIFLRGDKSSGIISLGEEEAERLISSLRNNIKLVSKIKKIKG